MSRLKRHLAKPIKKEFVNEDGEKDVFSFKPLPVEYLPEYMELLGEITKSGIVDKDYKGMSEKEQIKSILKLLNKETTALLTKLITKMIERSFPDEHEDDRNDFVSQHFHELIGVLMEANSYESKRQSNKVKK